MHAQHKICQDNDLARSQLATWRIHMEQVSFLAAHA